MINVDGNLIDVNQVAAITKVKSQLVSVYVNVSFDIILKGGATVSVNRIEPIHGEETRVSAQLEKSITAIRDELIAEVEKILGLINDKHQWSNITRRNTVATDISEPATQITFAVLSEDQYKRMKETDKLKLEIIVVDGKLVKCRGSRTAALLLETAAAIRENINANKETQDES